MAYKKTPPPVPPRTTSKPFISVTVQSSTESAQDTYLDSQDHKSEVTSQSGLSNSSDSLDSSTRPPSVTRGGVTPAPEAPEPPPKHAALKSEQGTLTSSESHPEAVPKRKLSSIGIQVGAPFTLCPRPAPRTCLRVITSGGGPLGLPGHGGLSVLGGWPQVAKPNSTHKPRLPRGRLNMVRAVQLWACVPAPMMGCPGECSYTQPAISCPLFACPPLSVCSLHPLPRQPTCGRQDWPDSSLIQGQLRCGGCSPAWWWEQRGA